MSAISGASNVSLPVSTSDAAPAVAQIQLLKASMDSSAQMMDALLQAIPQPTADGRTGGAFDAYA